jgi:hypothetical protein
MVCVDDEIINMEMVSSGEGGYRSHAKSAEQTPLRGERSEERILARALSS